VPPSWKPEKAASNANVLQGEVISPNDFFLEIEEQIDSFEDIDTLVSVFHENIERNELKLGLVLARIPAKKGYGEWGNFEDYVEEKHGIPSGRAKRLVKCYHNLPASKVRWDKVKHIGLTKLWLILPVLTADNADYWIAVAERLTPRQLFELIKVTGE